MFRKTLAPDAELVQLQLSDTREIYETARANLPRLVPWFEWAHDAMAQTDTEKFVTESLAATDRGEVFVCVLRIAGRLAGTADLHFIKPKPRRAEIGYWLADFAEGRGLATRAAAALTNHGFSTLNLNRIDIRAAAGNSRSRAVAERLGYTLEATLAEFMHVGGQLHDEAVYRMLARDWPPDRLTPAAATQPSPPQSHFPLPPRP
jgi:ribosomal-protein-serine acetyltransferase